MGSNNVKETETPQEEPILPISSPIQTEPEKKETCYTFKDYRTYNTTPLGEGGSSVVFEAYYCPNYYDTNNYSDISANNQNYNIIPSYSNIGSFESIFNHPILNPNNSPILNPKKQLNTTIPNVKVAIKVIYDDDESTFDSVKNEIDLMKALSGRHPNFVQLYDSFVVERDPIRQERAFCLVLEYCDQNLDNMLKKLEEPLPLEDSLCLILQLIDALQFLEANQIVHRDLKPENIFFQYNNHRNIPRKWTIKVGDLGISKKLTNSVRNYGNLDSMEDNFAGTVIYMASEQLEGKYSSPLCDVWSLGLTIFQISIGYSTQRFITLLRSIINSSFSGMMSMSWSYIPTFSLHSYIHELLDDVSIIHLCCRLLVNEKIRPNFQDLWKNNSIILFWKLLSNHINNTKYNLYDENSNSNNNNNKNINNNLESNSLSFQKFQQELKSILLRGSDNQHIEDFIYAMISGINSANSLISEYSFKMLATLSKSLSNPTTSLAAIRALTGFIGKLTKILIRKLEVINGDNKNNNQVYNLEIFNFGGNQNINANEIRKINEKLKYSTICLITLMVKLSKIKVTIDLNNNNLLRKAQMILVKENIHEFYLSSLKLNGFYFSIHVIKLFYLTIKRFRSFQIAYYDDFFPVLYPIKSALQSIANNDTNFQQMQQYFYKVFARFFNAKILQTFLSINLENIENNNNNNDNNNKIINNNNNEKNKNNIKKTDKGWKTIYKNQINEQKSRFISEELIKYPIKDAQLLYDLPQELYIDVILSTALSFNLSTCNTLSRSLEKIPPTTLNRKIIKLLSFIKLVLFFSHPQLNGENLNELIINSSSKAICTNHITNNFGNFNWKYQNDDFLLCINCSLKDNINNAIIICSVCAGRCHFGHQLIPLLFYTNSQCFCFLRGPSSCSSLPIDKLNSINNICNLHDNNNNNNNNEKNSVEILNQKLEINLNNNNNINNNNNNNNKEEFNRIEIESYFQSTLENSKSFQFNIDYIHRSSVSFERSDRRIKISRGASIFRTNKSIIPSLNTINNSPILNPSTNILFYNEISILSLNLSEDFSFGISTTSSGDTSGINNNNNNIHNSGIYSSSIFNRSPANSRRRPEGIHPYQRMSISYIANTGECLFIDNDQRKQLIAQFPPFGALDIVGFGILANFHLFFTKNGKLLFPFIDIRKYFEEFNGEKELFLYFYLLHDITSSIIELNYGDTPFLFSYNINNNNDGRRNREMETTKLMNNRASSVLNFMLERISTINIPNLSTDYIMHCIRHLLAHLPDIRDKKEEIHEKIKAEIQHLKTIDNNIIMN